NRVAHVLLGTDDPVRGAFAVDPWGTVPITYGLLDDLRASCLAADEVPIALLRWTAGEGLVFVDRWAVRRRVTQLDSAPRWPLLVAERVETDGEAAFLQFQDQIDELRASAGGAASPPAALAASDAFAYLPPVGILPVAGPGS